MRRFIVLFVLLPLAIVAIVLSVANRKPVSFSLDPIGSEPAVSLTAPLFVFLFAALALGILLGGIAAWLSQRKWRRAARTERANAARLRQEVESLRARAAAPSPGPNLVLPGPQRRDAA